MSRFGRSYIGQPDVLAEQLAADEAVQVADLLLLTVPNQLGVDYNVRLLDGWGNRLTRRSGGSLHTHKPRGKQGVSGRSRSAKSRR